MSQTGKRKMTRTNKENFKCLHLRNHCQLIKADDSSAHLKIKKISSRSLIPPLFIQILHTSLDVSNIVSSRDKYILTRRQSYLTTDRS